MWFIGLFGVIFFSFCLYKIISTKQYKKDQRLIPAGIIMTILSLAVFITEKNSSGETIVLEDHEDNVFSSQDTIVAGSVEYTVHSIDKKRKIKYDNGLEEKPYGKFIIFNVEVKNNYQYPIQINVSEYDKTNFALTDNNSYYMPDRNISYTLTNNKYGNGSFVHNPTNPGISMSAEIVFDIPEEVINSNDLQLVILTDDSAPDDIFIPVN